MTYIAIYHTGPMRILAGRVMWGNRKGGIFWKPMPPGNWVFHKHLNNKSIFIKT